MTTALSFPATTIHHRRPSPPENLSAPATPVLMLKSSLSVPLPVPTSHNRVKLRHSISSAARASRPRIRCDVALKSTASVDTDPSSTSSTSGSELGSDAVGAQEKAKVGTRVRVTVPLKVYHVSRVPEVDLSGMEGVLKDYVAIWKGKRISANLPYKVEFFTEIEGRGKVKFFAHLKEDEFEFLE